MIKGNNQSNGTKGQSIPIERQSRTEHDQTGENGRILRIFADGPPTPQQPTHHHHCLIQSIPVVLRERIKGKDCETVTKIEITKAHDTHLRTPTRTRRIRTPFSTNIQPISTQVASIHPSLQYGCNECLYVRIGWILTLLMADVAGMR